MLRLIEAAALAFIAALAGVAGYVLELLGPLATTRLRAVLLVVATLVTVLGAAILVLRVVEKHSRR